MCHVLVFKWFRQVFRRFLLVMLMRNWYVFWIVGLVCVFFIKCIIMEVGLLFAVGLVCCNWVILCRLVMICSNSLGFCWSLFKGKYCLVL